MNQTNMDLDNLPANPSWLMISKLKESNQVHVVPRFGRSHDIKLTCWCNAEEQFSPLGYLIVVHNMEH